MTSTPSKATAGHTPGPWAWFGNARNNSLYLATVHGGRRYVMDFTRWGMRGAQPRFQPGKGIMVDAKDLLQFEVGDQSIVGVEAAKKDTSVYRLDVRGIHSADARLIAAAPDLLAALEAILPFIPKSSAVEGGPNAGSSHVKAADKVRAAISRATGEA